jgi:hypothetical protein
MRISRAEWLGLSLIVIAVGLFSGARAYYKTRNLEPINAPISFQHGSFRRDFNVNLGGWYFASIDFTHRGGRDEHAEINKQQFRWRILRSDGSTVNEKSAWTEAYWGTSNTIYLGGTGLDRGDYTLEIVSLEESKLLNEFNPCVELYSITHDAEDLYHVCSWLAIIFALTGIAVISQRPRSDRLQAELEERAFNSPPSGNYQSNTISRRVRTPRRLSIPTLSMWAPVTALVLLVVLIVFWIFNTEGRKVGIWVRTVPPTSFVTTTAAHVRPVIVKVSLVNKMPVYSMDDQAFPIEQLSMRLRSQLSRLPEWVVYIDGAPTLELRDVGIVIDVANNLHAKVVLLTSKTGLRATDLLGKTSPQK